MDDVQLQNSELVLRSDSAGEYPAVLISFAVLESALASVSSKGIMRVELSDGTERLLAVSSVSPDEVDSMASNSTKRTAIANDLQSALQSVV